MCPPEKKARRRARGVQQDTFSGPVCGKNCGIAAISSDFQKNAADFLCMPDCVAEGEGFEPSVRFCLSLTTKNKGVVNWHFPELDGRSRPGSPHQQVATLRMRDSSTTPTGSYPERLSSKVLKLFQTLFAIPSPNHGLPRAKSMLNCVAGYGALPLRRSWARRDSARDCRCHWSLVHRGSRRLCRGPDRDGDVLEACLI
jgi:hypothetical protein